VEKSSNPDEGERAAKDRPLESGPKELIQEIQSLKQGKQSHEDKQESNGHKLEAAESPLREKPKWTDVAIVILTVGIVFTGVLQFLEMRDAGIQTDKIIAADQRLATAMEQTVLQSKQELDQAIKMSELDQRAWVGVKSIDLVPLEIDKPLATSVRLVNTGKTIALNAVMDIVQETTGSDLDIAKFALSKDRPRSKVHSPMVMFPNFEVGLPIQTPQKINAQDVENIKTRKLLVYIFGEIHYLDIFRHPHLTHFCGKLNPTRTPIVYDACETYNSAD
jgi:hypothetical protein